MASYEAQINLIVGGQRNLQNLANQLNAIENTISEIQNKWTLANAALQRANIRVGVAGTKQPRTATGRFAADPDRQARFAAVADQRRARAENFLFRQASARARAEATRLGSVIDDNKILIAQTERKILLQSRLNAAVDLYQRKLEEYSRGNRGGSTKISNELKARVDEIKRAFEVATDGGEKSLSLVRSLATELGRVVERQNEINRLSTFRSKALFQAQAFERNIADLRSRGVSASAFSGTGRQLREYRSAVSRGSQEEAEDAARKIKESLKRIARELEAGLKQAEIESKAVRSAKKAAQSWEKFFEDVKAVSVKANVRNLKVLTSWEKFFEDASVARTKVNTRKLKVLASWDKFFDDLDTEAARQNKIKFKRLSALRGDPNAYGAEAGPLPGGRPGAPRYMQELIDQQEQMLEVEKEISKIRDDSMRKSAKIEKEQLQDAKKRQKLYRDIASSLLDAASFGRGQQITKGAKNTAIRAGLGLGALGVGKAAAASSSAAWFMAQKAAMTTGLERLAPQEVFNRGLINAVTTFGGAVNDALNGIPAAVADVLIAIGKIPGALGLAAVAAYAFAPQVKNLTVGLFKLGKAAGETKIGSAVNQFLTNINPLATAAYGSIEALTNGLDQLRGKALNLQELSTKAQEISESLNNQYKKLPLALPAFGESSFKGVSSYNPTIGAIAGGGVRKFIQKQPIGPDVVNTLQQGYENADLLAGATGKLAARSKEAAEATLMFAEKLDETSDELQQAKQKAFELAEEIANAAAEFERFKLEAYAESANAYSRAILNLDRTFREYVQAGGEGLNVINQQSDAYTRASESAERYAQSLKAAGEFKSKSGEKVSQFGYEGINSPEDRLRKIQQLQEDMGLQPVKQPSLALRPAGYTNEDVRIKNLLDDVNNYERKLDKIASDGQLELLQIQLEAELDNIDQIFEKKNAEAEKWWAQEEKRLRAMPDIADVRRKPIAFLEAQQRIPNYPSLEGSVLDPASLRAQRRRRVGIGRLDPLERFYAGFQPRRQAERSARATSEGLIGGAFPLLFGQGLGASVFGGLGGAAGGFAGGGLGFGLSLIGTALGTAFDQLATAAKETGQALKSPIEGFEKLKEANLFATKQQEYYIAKLIEAGRSTEAAAAIQAEAIRKLGTKGYNDLIKLADSSTNLNKKLAELGFQMQALIAGPLSSFIDLLTRVTGGVNTGFKINAVSQRFYELTPEQVKAVRAEIQKQKPNVKSIDEFVAVSMAAMEKVAPQPVKQSVKTPEQADIDRQKSIQLADEIKSAYREGFQLQQRAIDLQRQGIELQRRVADDIFNKQQEIQRNAIQVESKKRQIAIETVDLEYRKRISNEEGRVAEMLAAEADLIKMKSQNEADIEAQKRNLELDIAKQRRETENYIYNLGRDLESIRRGTLEYEMQVIDYREQIERKISEQRRIDNAAAALAGVNATGRNYANVGGFMNNRQMLHGIPGFAGKDPGHSGAKAHYHFSGKNPQETKAVADYIRTLKFNDKLIQITEFGQYGQRVGDHAAGSQHYKEQGYNAFDVPGDQVPVGQEIALMKFVHKAVNDFLASGTAATSVISQFKRAAAPVVTRPQIATVSQAETSSQMRSFAEQDAALKKESVALQEKLNKLQEYGALERIKEAAIGERGLKSRRDANLLAQNEINSITAGNQELQDRAALEAQLLTKLQIRDKEDEDYLAKTKLTGKEKQAIVDAMVLAREIAVEQNKLDREALTLAQQKRFDIEKASIATEGMFRNIGVRAGYIGQAAAVFEAEMRASGNLQQAKKLADMTQKNETAYGNQMLEAYNRAATEMQQIATWENIGVTAAQNIGDAFGNAFQQIASGTASAREILAGFFQNLANAFSNMASQMISNMIQMLIYKQLLGPLMPGFNALQSVSGSIGSAAFAPSFGSSWGGFAGALGMPALMANGGMFANGIQPFAKGGIVSSPTLFKFADGGAINAGVMGEAGPEAILPLSRGSDGRLGVQAGGGGTTNVTVNVDASGSKVQGDNQQANQLGRVLSTAVQEEIIRQKRPGGLLA